MTPALSITRMPTASKPTAEPAVDDATDPRIIAIAARDRAWDGTFVFGVTSTRIFCRPSCPSRRPRADRIRLFDDVTAARSAGFRACRRCHPDSVGADDDITRAVTQALRTLDEAEGTITLDALAAHVGVSRAHLQRSFTRLVGCSPHEWQAARRTSRMRTSLADGESVSAAAFDAGFDSLPSAYAAAERHLGMSPGALKRGAAGETVRYTVVGSALGPTLVATTARGVCRVLLGDDAAAIEDEFRREYHAATLLRDDAAFAPAVRQVIDAASGETLTSPVPLDLRGTAFQQRVWRELTSIPRGTTATYAEIAARIGAPNATRAVGTACGANPVAVVVPCHRVVRGDGALGGYRWGLARKRQLLESERAANGGR